MSAYLVSSDTIDLLSSVAAYWRESSHSGGLSVRVPLDTAPLTNLEETNGASIGSDAPWSTETMRYTWSYGGATFSDVGAELYAGNVASLAARYLDYETMISYTWTPSGGVILPDSVSVGDVLGALRCYEYQSCEASEWENTFTYALVRAIERKVIGYYSTGWNYARPANSAKVISLYDMAKGH